MTLQEFFAENARAAIAFSGGVDSSYLLYAAVQCGADVHAYFAKTAFQPQFELDDARRLAESVGARLTVLELDALSSEDVARNPANRCYYCKQNIFGNLKRAAAEDGFTLILDGTNASDDAGDRPGMRALREMDVRSPLRECGLTKTEIRRLSHEAGLFTWDKPAYACLATRVPTGTRITPELLAATERAEGWLFSQGYSGHGVTCTHLAGRLISELLRGDAERFDAFANLPHYPFPGGRSLRIPFTAMGAAYYSLRDRLGV